MSFQWIIDGAESISIERKQVVAGTQSRSGIIRNVSRGASTWQFTVKLPDGPRWTDYRQLISQAEKLDRMTSAVIQFNNTGHDWLVGYQGNSANYTGFQARWTQGDNSITLFVSPTTSSGYKFRAGDIIQLGTTGKVYTVSEDVAFNSNVVPLHRPVLDATVVTNQAIRVAENCQFTVLCSSFPNWTLFARDQISWSGPFVFTEVI